MNLRGRDLAPNVRGADVTLLQSELRQLKLNTQIVDPDGFFGSTTFLAVQEFQRLHGMEATGIVDRKTAQLINKGIDDSGGGQFVVRGEVRQADGSPIRDAAITLFRKGIRRDERLGHATTAALGDYGIEYAPAETPISVFVRASDSAGKSLADSPIICRARPVEIVNLTVGGVLRRPPEFQQLHDKLQQILRTEQIRLEALQADDVQVLACTHDLDASHVAYLVASARMARESEMQPEMFYGLLRQGLPTTLIALVAQSTEVLQGALERSVNDNLIGLQVTNQIPRMLRDLQGQIVRLALAEPTPDRPTFRSLLEMAGVPQQHQQAILESYLQREGTVPQFWNKVAEQTGMNDADIESAQYAVGVASMVVNHLPLVRELVHMRRVNQIGRNLGDLAQFTREDWTRLLSGASGSSRIGAPAVFGQDADERERRYAAFLPRMVETIYPTAVLGHRLEAVDRRAFAPTLEFLRQNVDFEFQNQRVDEFLRERPEALNGVGDREATLHQLRAVQRMMNIAPQFDKARTVALITTGIDSAFAIRRMGAAQFIRSRTEQLGGKAIAEQVYTNAARQADTALLLLSQSFALNTGSPGIIPFQSFGEGVPELEQLFGSVGLCQCEHCDSVYSPAAYLVDILHFLMNRDATTPGRAALDVLFGNPGDETRRRWDIGEIELSCDNTNTELPHIDLVNEILENAVAPRAGFPFQTESKADVLGANPEHVNEQAYDTLASAVYPWTLPFDLWAAEARQYLGLLGVHRETLMENFRREGAPPSPIDVSAEYLGLTPHERSVINGSAEESTRQMWGMESAEFTRLLSERTVSVVLERSGLSYEELLELLGVEVVNTVGAMAVNFAGSDCNLATATIAGLTTARLERIHRFVRLQRKLGWPISDVGRVLSTLGVTNLNDNAIVQLAQVRRLREALNVSLETMLSWWSQRLSTQSRAGEPSLYDRLFNDQTVDPPEADLFRLNHARTELDHPTLSVNDHISAISAALSLSPGDLALLAQAELPDDSLNLANLTQLLKASTLANSSGLSTRGYISMRALTGVDPFESVVSTETFVDRVREIRESGFDLETLDYLLRHDGALVQLTDARAVEFLIILDGALQQVVASYEFASDPAGTRTSQTLSLILSNDLVNRAVRLLGGDSTEVPERQIALIHEQFSQFLDPLDAVAQLVDPGTLAAGQERFDYVLQRVLDYLSRSTREALVVESVARALDLGSEIVNPLLRELLHAQDDSSQPMLSAFLDSAADRTSAFHLLAKIAITLNALEIPAENVRFALTRGEALGWLDLSALPLQLQASGGPVFERWRTMVTLFRATATLSGGASTLFAILSDLDHELLGREQFLDSVAQRTQESGWNRTDLAFLTGPGGFNLEFPAGFSDAQFLIPLKRSFELLSRLGVTAEEAWSWAVPAPDAITARAIKQAARTQFDNQEQWLAAAKSIRDPLRNQQRDALVGHLLNTVRITFPSLPQPQPELSLGDRSPVVRQVQWRLNAAGAAPPLQIDSWFGLATRAAVIAFQHANNLTADGIVGQATWAALNQVRQRLRGPNDLYSHFLVDVEMDSCMLTSRLVLATNSVQLFVQRCLLNLEPEVELSPEDAKEWEWMKNYRVWEANRKIFLYPENWIEPELRDDKTPFFRNLESGLLQDVVNDSTAEREYLKYLRDLDRVAQLDISGLYREWESSRDILHVFGRTRATPHVHYYRRWVDQQYWSPWERVEVDIEGDHVIPVVWNRRLYLFWPMFLEKPVQEISQEARLPDRYYEVRLAWSEQRDGKWSARTISESVFWTTPQPTLSPKDQFSFWPYLGEDGDLFIAYQQADSSPDNPSFQQFHFASSGTSPEVVSKGSVDSTAPPGTRTFYNKFREFGSKSFRLVTAAVEGSAYQVDFSYTNPTIPVDGGVVGSGGGGAISFVSENILKTSDSILRNTPGTFRLVLADAERPHRSQTPLFYQDEQRTFFIVPQGKYVGGHAGGIDDFTIELHSTPLELPEIVTVQIAEALAPRTPIDQVETLSTLSVSRTSGRTLRLQPDNILSPPAIFAQSSLPLRWEAKWFHFQNFYHPFVSLLIEQLNRHGIEGVLKPDPEQESSTVLYVQSAQVGRSRREVVKDLRRQQNSHASFVAAYDPNPANVANVRGLSPAQRDVGGPLETFDFSYGGAYSAYNWELFFHAPFMIAKRLSVNQRFGEAHRWFQYIFDPTGGMSTEAWPRRVWQIRPFFDYGAGKSIERSLLLLRSRDLSAAELEERQSLRDQIEAWRKNPFNPHLIARMRNEAYMKTVVMAYLDNLIAWGDNLFRQDTRESINEATQLYILAGEILGERPQEIAAHDGTRRTVNGVEVSTFNQLRNHLDDFSNALIDLETILYPSSDNNGPQGMNGILNSVFTANPAVGSGDDGLAADVQLVAPSSDVPDNGFVVDLPLAAPVPAVLGPTLFFCIPKNDKLLGYWDTVVDRLFKIRHCQNIAGVSRQLALFAPPIDPALLVKAAAAGLDIASVLADLNAPPPNYRFQVLAQKVNEIIGDVKSLGAALLAALEKKDAEELALLRSTQELQVLAAVRNVKQKQIDETRASKESLEKAKRLLEERRDSYLNRGFENDWEIEHLVNREMAAMFEDRAGEIEIMRSVFGFLIPDFDIGLEGVASSPVAEASWGGSNIMDGMEAEVHGFEYAARKAAAEAEKALTRAGYQRRKEEWDFQAAQASTEIEEAKKQITAAEIRLSIAEQELKNHDLQAENSKAVDEVMRGKFTNEELYAWMVPQISSVYFRSYQVVEDMAKRAERAFGYELGVTDPDFIEPGSWESLKKGLLAGERLQHTMRRMEAAYLDQNSREYEITKHISLATLDSSALTTLRDGGECFVDFPEFLFDMDYPGHFFRRMKTAGLTIMSVAAPNTSVNCTLTLVSNSLRRSASPSSPYPRNLDGEDDRFGDNIGAIQSIVTSTAQNDSGLFEVNLQDERYLPFEGAGAISRWHIELPIETNVIDRTTISDILIHLRYTAREGGAGLRAAALASLPG